jgi:predicted MFS family arabinose efflux permease
VLAYRQLRESSDPEHSRLDPVGLVTLTAGLLCLILALIEGNRRGWSSGLILGLFAAAAVLLVVFVVSQARGETTMIDLALFKRPAFVGAQTTAFAISSSMFAMFLYLTLYLQNILGLSPLETGVRFLPLSIISFFAAPIAGRLSARMPIRVLLGAGLALNAIALWLMSRVSSGSHWTVLLPGFLVGGIGIGMVNAPLASTAVSTVRVERAGMASGINNTFRQIGIATGIAALGAIFQARVESKLSELPLPRQAASRVGELAEAIASGGSKQAIGNAPPQARGQITEAANQAFVAGFNTILLVAVVIAVVGAVSALVLVRKRDFVAVAAPESVPASA